MEVEFEPVGLSVKQNSPVDCFVARGGEIGTAAAGWGDEPRNFFEIAESHRQEKPHLLYKQGFFNEIHSYGMSEIFLRNMKYTSCMKYAAHMMCA